MSQNLNTTELLKDADYVCNIENSIEFETIFKKKYDLNDLISLKIGLENYL